MKATRRRPQRQRKTTTAAVAAPDAASEAEADDDSYAAAVRALQADLANDLALWSRIFSWAFVHALGKLDDPADYDERSRSRIDEWLLGRLIAGALRDAGMDEADAGRAVVIIKRLTSQQHWYVGQGATAGGGLLEGLLSDSEMQQLLGVNRYQGVLWFNQQSFERLLWWLLLLAAVMLHADPAHSEDEAAEALAACHATLRRLRAAAAESGYQVEKLVELAQAAG